MGEKRSQMAEDDKYTIFLIFGNANKRHLDVSYVLSPPDITRDGKTVKGSDVDILESLSSRLSFTVSYKNVQSFN